MLQKLFHLCTGKMTVQSISIFNWENIKKSCQKDDSICNF